MRKNEFHSKGYGQEKCPEMHVAKEYLGRIKNAQLHLISKHLSNIYYSQGTEANTLKPSHGFIFS